MKRATGMGRCKMTMTKQDKWVFAKEMVDKGHTQTAVAEMLHVSKTTITSYLFKAKYEIEAGHGPLFSI